MVTDSPWNQAPVRLWKRISIFVRPDIHETAREHDENFTLFLNNVLARKYDLPLCPDDRVRKAKRLRRLEETTAALEHEIAALSAELRDDHLGQEIRNEMERQHAEIVAVKDERARTEAGAASRARGIRDALDAIVGGDPTGRYRRTLPENDGNGDRVDDWEALVAQVSRRCGAAIDSAEIAAELRRRAATGSAEGGA